VDAAGAKEIDQFKCGGEVGFRAFAPRGDRSDVDSTSGSLHVSKDTWRGIRAAMPVR
jgi:hypothetical protein